MPSSATSSTDRTVTRFARIADFVVGLELFGATSAVLPCKREYEGICLCFGTLGDWRSHR